MVLVRFVVHGAADVDTAVRSDGRRTVFEFCGDELVVDDRLSLRQGRTSLFPRQFIFQQERGERRESVLGPWQWLGDGRPGADVAVFAVEPSGSSAVRAII